MTPHLTTTPDGVIVYDPPHEHTIVMRNGVEAWCCSTRGTIRGRIGPLTYIPSGVGYLRERAKMKKARRAKLKSAREKAERELDARGSGPALAGTNAGAPPLPNPSPASNRADTTPSYQSMSGPSGKTATNGESETATNETTRVPARATADLVASAEPVVGAREVTTENGETCILVAADGTEYWGSALLLEQLRARTDILPDVVVEAVSQSGRRYRTFSKARAKPTRTYGVVPRGA